MNQALKLGKGWEADTKIVKVSVKHKLPNSVTVPNSETIETMEYNVFSRDNRNRPITEERVNFFMKQFKNGRYFLKEFPAIVDSNFIILDGQHRFEAVRRLELPFYFRFSDILTINNVVDVQVNAGWSPADYLHSYVQQTKMDYIVLHRFIERYHFTASVAVMILSGNSRGLKKNGFYEGNFKVKDETLSHKQAQAISEIGVMLENLHRQQPFCIALIKAMNHPEYEHKRFKEQVEKYGSMLKRQINIETYLRVIEEVYNYKLYQKNKLRFL